MLDVLIIGAGPTGLLMAAEAARLGMKCRIVDKAQKPSEKSRALAIQPRTLEIFDHLGIAALFLEEGLKVRAGNQYSGSEKLFRLSFEDLNSPYPFVLSLEQSKTEKILTDYLASFGVQVERGVELIDIEEQKDRVVGICRDLNGRQINIEAKWIVGCDGAHSVVRKKLGFSFVGKAFPSVFSLADVSIQWSLPHDELTVFLNSSGIMAAIPMPGKGRYRLVFELERCRALMGIMTAKIPDPTIDEVKAIVKKYGGSRAKVSDPSWFANFHINSRLVESYQKGRIFIAGDAAHIHSPAGGQGMNSGLQDVFNLAWKLASGNDALIDTYTLERRSWGKSLLKATHLFTKTATLSNPIAVAVRNRIISWVAPLMQKRIVEAIAQVSIQYPKSQIAGESGSFHGGPKAGMRAINVPVGQTDLYSILRRAKAHHLLNFGFEAKTFRGFESRGMSVIDMDYPEAGVKYGVKKQAVYIIRPDQYVGYRSSKIDLDAIQSYYQSVF